MRRVWNRACECGIILAAAKTARYCDRFFIMIPDKLYRVQFYRLHIVWETAAIPAATLAPEFLRIEVLCMQLCVVNGQCTVFCIRTPDTVNIRLPGHVVTLQLLYSGFGVFVSDSLHYFFTLLFRHHRHRLQSLQRPPRSLRSEWLYRFFLWLYQVRTLTVTESP